MKKWAITRPQETLFRPLPAALTHPVVTTSLTSLPVFVPFIIGFSFNIAFMGFINV